MPVSVMQVRIVRVLVSHWRVMVPMCVRFTGWISGAMSVLVMLIVNVAMIMVQRLVLMLVHVPL